MKGGTAGCKRWNKINNLFFLCDGLCRHRGGGPSPTWSVTVTIVLSRFSKCRENERFLIERGLVQPLKKYLTAEYLALLHFFPNMHGNICN